MNELAELASLRAEVAGNRPEELPRARRALNAEIRAACEPGRRRSPAGLRAWWAASPRAGRITVHGRLAGRLRAGPRPRVALAGGAAIVLSAAVAAGFLIGLPGHGRPTGNTVLTAAYVLERAASAAATSPQPVPGPGQYIFVTSVDTWMTDGDTRSWLTVDYRQLWQSVDGRKASLLRDTILRNERLPWGRPAPAAGRRVSWVSMPAQACPPPLRARYPFLTTLPTNPARLRAWIYGHKNGGQSADDQAWTDIGDLLGGGKLMPPKLAAALFKVAATIPGATVISHATDAAGRAGIAVARVAQGSQEDSELIFDPRTYRYLGERSTITAPVKNVGPAGTVIGSSALLKVAVASHLPHHPVIRRPC
jgi:hypothetical protein